MPGQFTTWDSYLWEPGGSVLRNLYGERDLPVLSLLEYGETFKRQRELEAGKVDVARTYDAGHLRAIHGHLFANVYEWAGEYRSVNMSKGSAPGGFADTSQIGRYLADANRVIVATDWRSLDREGFAAVAATAFAYVNQAHPFREGNGRAAKVFMEQVAEQSGFTLDYARVPPRTWNEASMFSAPDLGSYEPVPDSLVPVFRELAVEATVATAPHRATWPGAGAAPGQLAGAAQIPDVSGPQVIAQVGEPLTTSPAQAARKAAGLSFPVSPREALRGGGSARARVDRGGVKRGRGGELDR